jgi:hypothetical protein
VAGNVTAPVEVATGLFDHLVRIFMQLPADVVHLPLQVIE